MSDTGASPSLFVVGLNHRTTPIELRERLAISSDEAPGILTALSARLNSHEVLLVATCNRVEIYGFVSRAEEEAFVRAVFADRAPSLPDKHLYEHKDREAVRHLFRVTSSLDSMVVGEAQITGQIKHAYGIANAAGTIGSSLHRLVHRALRVAKRVRTETAIGVGSVSVGSIAADLASQIFEGLHNRLVVLIGAGEMAEQVIDHLRALGTPRIAIANRSFERAQALASRYAAAAHNLGDVDRLLTEADIVVTSTSAQGFIVTRESVRMAQRKRRFRPLFLVDIAVPRNIEPSTEELENVYLYDIDDLQNVTAVNRAERERSLGPADRIVDAEVERYFEWHRTLDGLPLLVELRAKAARIAEEEFKKSATRRKWDDDTRESVEVMLNAVVNRFLHSPSVFLKEELADPNPFVLEVIRDLFALQQTAEKPDLEKDAPQSEAASSSVRKV
ncbi:MAG: glutamyl-tRNA reductase [Deltaproteobacteria bacterium]|nr:glutamyl-tRNA reductase [Deltaproteobacteria bacterium]